MKRYMYLIFLLGLYACQEDDLVMYSQEKDAMQFLLDEDKGVSSKLAFNFATATYTVKENDSEREYYYGDSLASMTYNDKNSIILELQGFPSPDERPYKLKTVLLEGQDSSKVAKVVFDSYYSLAPNMLYDTIQLTVLRPEKRGTYRVGIMIDTENSYGFFEKGAFENSVLELEIKDTYEKPEGWDERKEWLGEFEEEKYAFMVTYSQQAFSRANKHMWNETDAYNQELRKALEDFNTSAAPEDRKTFTFPATTKPIWWDSQSHLLGEFSEEKHTFMKNIVGGNLPANEKLEYWNIVFRKKLEEEGRTDIEIPRNEKMVSWWNNTALGDWSLEKQEFVILNLFPLSKYSISNTTWDYANVILREIAEKQATPLPFEFPIEGEPYWWPMRAEMLGDFSVAKRDLLVSYVFKMNVEDDGIHNIYQLVDSGWPLENLMEDFRWQANQWNAAHPDETPITFPITAPAWWKGQLTYLGEWSEAKENYVKEIVASFQGWYNSGFNGIYWNAILRYELALYNSNHTPHEFDFPVANVKPSYWDREELDYLGEYTESKWVFVCIYLKPQNNGGDWYLGVNNPNNIPRLKEALKKAYDEQYNGFMTKYATSNPEPFTFPTE